MSSHPRKPKPLREEGVDVENIVSLEQAVAGVIIRLGKARTSVAEVPVLVQTCNAQLKRTGKVQSIYSRMATATILWRVQARCYYIMVSGRVHD